MTSNEKSELYDRLDETLLMRRDRGHMLIPKLCFLPFVRSLIRGVELKANSSIFEICGVRTPEICHCYIEEKRPELFDMFVVAAGRIKVNEMSSVVETCSIIALKILFDVWVEKLVNCRIAEWFKAKQVLDLEESKRRRVPEGCQSLRQRLYALIVDD